MNNSAMFKQQQSTNNNTLKSSQFNSINASIRLSEQEAAAAKKNALSMDSINAVERELDEVLKDLELNSQDLNDQLNNNHTNSDTHFNSNSNNNNNGGHLFHNHQGGGNKLIIELPITIQKSVKINTADAQSPCSSPSMNNHRQQQQQHHLRPNSTTNITKTPVHFHNAGLYIDDSEDYHIGNKEPDLNSNNNSRKQQRANIVSTYELCHECQDGGEGHSKSCNKSTSSSHNSDFTSLKSSSPPTNNSNNSSSASSSLYNHLMNSSPASTRNNPSSHSNQDLSTSNSHFNSSNNSSHFANNGSANNNNNSDMFHLNVNNRSRSVLAQINEVAEHNLGGPSSSNPSSSSSNNPKHHSFSYLRSSSNNAGNGVSNGNSGGRFVSNGNVISQKIVSIGMPTSVNSSNAATTTGSPRTHSPSPKLAEFKSIFLL
jgi:hypothetical protein